jgi:acetyltransferase-like isoleucine patch superfamily enzyme
MSEPDESNEFVRWPIAGWMRFAWAIASAFAVESLVIGLAALPAVLFWEWHWSWDVSPHAVRVILLAMSLLPAYLLFAVALMALSGISTRVLGWRPQAPASLRIAELGWPLLDWARYSISIHVVRVFAGTLLRTTPLWTWYMRLNGAQIGRRVWINSLDVTDHCLLDFGDDVVIGAAVHLSGHTVDHGLVQLAPVRLGHNVTVGLGANVEIGVEAGAGCQIGAMAVVPKFAKLRAHTRYVGAPVHPLERKDGHAS